MNIQNLFTLLVSFLILICSSSKCEKVVGLKNFGETCYANAVFQLLYHSKDFRASLAKYLNEAVEGKADRNILALNGIFKEMDKAENFASIIPNTFDALPSDFKSNTQYDVQEVLIKYQQGIPNLDWTLFTIKFLESQIIPSKTTTESVDFELLLDVPECESETNLNLNNLLNYNFKGYRRIYTINSLPNNLVLRIRRLHKVHGVDEKITRRIEIPEILSLHPFASSAKFKLNSFIEHCGNEANGGHYQFYLHHKDLNEYFVISDEIITKISGEQFIEKAAYGYVFLYEKYL